MFDDKKNQDWRTSGEANNQILKLEYKEKTFLSKEEVANQWVVSKATFENWLAKIPAKIDEFKIEKNGKKLFRSDYVEKLVKMFGKKKAEPIKEIAEPIPSQNDNLWEKIVESKNNQIQSLTNQIEQMATQLANQWRANEKLLQIVNQSQVLELEKLDSKKKLELPENLPKKTNQNWWISLLVFFNLKNEKDKPNDN
jgi:hypothetical protein